MKISTIELDDVLIITTEESRIDAAQAVQFKNEMRKACALGPDRVFLDMAHVEFVDSSGLGAIVASLKQLPDGKTLELFGLTPGVQRVFELTRMDSIFQIHSCAPTEVKLKTAS